MKLWHESKVSAVCTRSVGDANPHKLHILFFGEACNKMCEFCACTGCAGVSVNSRVGQ